MRAVITFARFTVQEALSRRMILAGLVLSAAFLALFALGFSLMYSNFSRGVSGPRGVSNLQMLAGASGMLTLLGVNAVSVLSSFLALFLSAGCISSEVDSGTLHAVLARPVRRSALVLGRWFAYVFLIVLYVVLVGGGLLLIAYAISGYEAPDPARAGAFLVLQGVIVLSLGLFGSTRLPTLANGVVVFGLFGLARLGGVIEFLGHLLDNTSMLNVGTAVNLLIPTEAVWQAASYYLQTPALLLMTSSGPGVPLVAGAEPPMALVAWGTAYPLVFLGAALVSFSRRDL